MLKSPIGVHVPCTAHAPYAWSASATAPVHVDIHIPLILLGSKQLEAKVEDDYTTGTGPIARRLQLVHAYLAHALKETGVAVLLWNAPSNPEKLNGTETDEERRVVESSREIWKQVEERKRATAEQSKAWALRATPQSIEEEPFDVHEGWRVGDGLLTEKEKEVLAHDANVWALPFMIQRYSLLLKDKTQWEDEVKIVMNALKAIGETEHPELGRVMVVLASERCHPHVTFRQAASIGGVAVPWDEQAVKNLLLLMTAFERELGVFATPEFLLTYKPLSNYLTKREVRRLRREKRQMWRNFWQAMMNDRGKTEEGRLRRRRRWDRKVLAWLGQIGEEDKIVQRREELLGEDGKAWWKKLYEMLEQGEAADIVNDIAKRTEGGGGSRVALNIGISPSYDQDNPARFVANFQETTVDTETDERQPDNSQPQNHHGPSYIGPSLPHNMPPVVALSFPIPLPGTVSLPLLAYVDILSRIVQFGLENAKDSILPFLDGLKKNEKRARDTPLKSLVGLAEQIGCEEEKVETLKSHVQQYMQEDNIRSIQTPEPEMSHSFGAFESHTKRMHEQGRRAICSVTRHARGDTVSNDDTASFPLTYLDRYEYVHGYLAISKTKTLKLLEAEDSASKQAKIREDTAKGTENEDTNVEVE